MRSLGYIVPRLFRKILNPAAIDSSKIARTACCDIGSVVNTSTMGRYSYIGEFTRLLYTDVGDFCSISNFCAIGGASHPMEWVSMSPAFNDSKGMMNSKISRLHYEPYVRTVIGNDVWIGSHCLIKAGVTIGDGAIIGMGSVITHDVGSYEIWAGNPAKLIRKRFDDQTIEQLKEIKWWELSDKELSGIADDMDNVERFIANNKK